MAETFFKQLINTERLLLSVDKAEESPYLPEALAVFQNLKTYVYSCKWNNTEKTRLMIRYIHKPSLEAGSLMGISKHTVRCVRSRASSRLLSIFGTDVFDIITGDDEGKLQRLNIFILVQIQGYDHIDNFIPSLIQEKLFATPRTSDCSYCLDELEEEIKFLIKYDAIAMLRSYQELNLDKLRFMFDVLQEEYLLNGGQKSFSSRKIELLSVILQQVQA